MESMTATVQLSDQIRAFLSAPRFGVLATIGDGGVPHQTVIW
jgi:nitroimidazol reductase NimA-like FMN-containing flavoprotein (pyridoxamine 5'-phosphate oxidase superfamily)